MIYEHIDLDLDFTKMGYKEPTHELSFTAYCASKSTAIDGTPRPAVVLCPGGGYAMTSDREAEPIALALVAKGVQVFVLRYAVHPDQYPLALLQAARAVQYVREHAAYYNVNPEYIGIAGFSAGGHLACSLSVFWNKAFIAKALDAPSEVFRPDFQMLAYPVISSGIYRHQSSFELLLGDRLEELEEEMSLEKQVHGGVPRSFIWHTDADKSVPVENALLLAVALKEHKIPMELHIYDRGEHGLALGNELTMTADGYAVEEAVVGWVDLFVAWLSRQINALD